MFIKVYIYSLGQTFQNELKSVGIIEPSWKPLCHLRQSNRRMSRVVGKLTRIAHKLSQFQNSKEKNENIDASLQKKVLNWNVFNYNNNNNTSLKFTDIMLC